MLMHSKPLVHMLPLHACTGVVVVDKCANCLRVSATKRVVAHIANKWCVCLTVSRTNRTVSRGTATCVKSLARFFLFLFCLFVSDHTFVHGHSGLQHVSCLFAFACLIMFWLPRAVIGRFPARFSMFLDGAPPAPFVLAYSMVVSNSG